jgi:hypothetical protein
MSAASAARADERFPTAARLDTANARAPARGLAKPPHRASSCNRPSAGARRPGSRRVLCSASRRGAHDAYGDRPMASIQAGGAGAHDCVHPDLIAREPRITAGSSSVRAADTFERWRPHGRVRGYSAKRRSFMIVAGLATRLRSTTTCSNSLVPAAACSRQALEPEGPPQSLRAAALK